MTEDFSKLSVEGQTYYTLLTETQKKAAKQIYGNLRGFTVSEAAQVLDYIKEIILLAVV